MYVINNNEFIKGTISTSIMINFIYKVIFKYFANFILNYFI